MAITKPTSAVEDSTPDPDNERVLEAKYLDWCSARVAERFLKLTPEEIFDHAQRASRLAPGDDLPVAESAFFLRAIAGRERLDAPPGTSLPDADPKTDLLPDPNSPSFRLVVQRVTEVLAAELHLPTFEEWVEAYREAPEDFDQDLLGFWREAL